MCGRAKCRNYDCGAVDSAHLAECLRLKPCRPTTVSQSTANDVWHPPGPLLPSSADSLRLLKACVKAHCTSSAQLVDVDCVQVMCSRRLHPTERQQQASEEKPQQSPEKRTSSEAAMETEKRAGFTDTAGACMAFHCGGKSPGTVEFWRCASRNRCAG